MFSPEPAAICLALEVLSPSSSVRVSRPALFGDRVAIVQPLEFVSRSWRVLVGWLEPGESGLWSGRLVRLEAIVVGHSDGRLEAFVAHGAPACWPGERHDHLSVVEPVGFGLVWRVDLRG